MDGEPLVFLIDGDPAIRRSLGQFVGATGWALEAFASAQAFLQRPPPVGPACLVLDLHPNGLSGLELLQELNGLGRRIPIVFLAGYGDVSLAARAMKAGAFDVLQKPCTEQELREAVLSAVEQDRRARVDRREQQEIQQRLATLTPRQREVLERVVAGRLNKQIAAELGTCEQTVKVHRARVMQKMQAHSVAELTRLAGRVGIGNDIPPVALRSN